MKVMALRDDIRHGHTVAATAEAFRQDTRWNVKPGDSDREKQLGAHLEEIREAMIPIRSALGRAQYGQVTEAQEKALREVSARLQYQRKQLKKMRRS